MRNWVIACSVLFGITSLVRTSDPGRIIGAVAIGAGVGVVLYGAYVAVTSVVSSARKPSLLKGASMNKFIWLLVFIVTVVIQATSSDFLWALGYSIPWFVAGMVFSPIWWGVTKKGRTTPWQWFDWLNAGAYIMVGLLIFGIFVNSWVRTQIGG